MSGSDLYLWLLLSLTSDDSFNTFHLSGYYKIIIFSNGDLKVTGKKMECTEVETTHAESTFLAWGDL